MTRNTRNEGAIGWMVRAKTGGLGYGKVVGSRGRTAQVEYFISIAERLVVSVDATSLQRVRIQPQTRCYVLDEDGITWQMGRIGGCDRDKGEYEVTFSGNRASYVSEREIYVRCNRPVSDPTEVLALKGHETPFFHTRRAAFLRSLIEQRATGRGLTGLMSANIELYAHQVEVARRVLEDPVQRYLLADEVGLGKTIEAGIILRQFLLDDPAGQALVLVPRFLVEQWTQELEEKFRVFDSGRRVFVEAFEDLRETRAQDAFGLVVIDEAHHISSGAFSSDSQKKERFDLCRVIARKTARLLLLSATPVLHNERDFLAMLHLLDPATYGLGDVEELKLRVRARQDLGRILLSFREGAHPTLLRANIVRLLSTFPSDKRLLALTDSLTKSLDSADASDEVRASCVRAIRTHVSDTYRLYRRMLRTRRDAVELAPRLDDKATDLVCEPDIDERSTELLELLSEWRVCAFDAASSTLAIDGLEKEYGQVFVTLSRAAGSWLPVLDRVVAARLQRAPCDELVHEFGQDALEVLCTCPYFEGETELLKKVRHLLARPSDNGGRVSLLMFVLARLRRTARKVVVFTSFRMAAKEIVARIGGRFGESAVAAYLAELSRDDVEEGMERFRSQTDCFVLVCDSSGEEGRNLQFVDWIVHFDLPQSPNRLEQRIGRLHRIGRERPVQSRVFIGPDEEDSFEEAWFKVMRDGFGVFRESVASLQAFLDAKVPELETILFRSGAPGLVAAVDEVHRGVEEERVRINEQNALDEIDARESRAAEYYDGLVALDGQSDMIRGATEGWLCDALKFARTRNQPLGRVEYRRHEGQTLVPADIILEFLAYSIQQPGTYDRAIAASDPGVTFLRIGSGMLDGLASYIRWDDRGQAFAMWRREATWSAAEGAEWRGFRFDYVVEACLDSAYDVMVLHGMPQADNDALQRRTDFFFPPRVETVFVDESMAEVRDGELLEILARPFERDGHPNRDVSLTEQNMPVLERFYEPEYWVTLCRQARDSSESVLRQRQAFIEACESCASKATRELARRLDQFTLRLERESEESQRASLTRELALEHALSTALVEGVRTPSVRLDSIGYLVVSGRDPAYRVERQNA